MTIHKFNEKWINHLKEGYYGLSIDHPEVISYLDNEFTKEVIINPSFFYKQIKMKFNNCVIYANSNNTIKWQNYINTIFLK